MNRWARRMSTATTACSSTAACRCARPGQETTLELSETAGHPVVEIALVDTYDLGQEFFRREIATAVAGSVLGIHPFNEPDVEASKIVTRQLTAEYEKSGKLPPETPIFEDGGVRLFAEVKPRS